MSNNNKRRIAPGGNDSDRQATRIRSEDSDDTVSTLAGSTMSRTPRGGGNSSAVTADRPTTSPSTRTHRILTIPISPRRRSHDSTGVTATTSSSISSPTNPLPATVNIEEIYPDGDLILNFRYCMCQSLTENLESGSGMEGVGYHLLDAPGNDTQALGQPCLRLRVSSAVLSVASAPLKTLVSDSASSTPSRHDHPLVMICPPRVWGFRESPSEATVILNCNDGVSLLSVKHALKILFLILHFRTASLHHALKVAITVRVAELAWVFGCVGPILPWMQIWIGEHRQAGMWVQSTDIESQGGQGRNPAPDPNNNPGLIIPAYTSPYAWRWMVVSWVVGDAKAFERSSRDYIYSDFQPSNLSEEVPADKHSVRDLGVVARLYEDLYSSRNEFIRGIYAVLNDTFTENCSNAASNLAIAAADGSTIQGAFGVLPAHVHALMLGSLVQSVMQEWGSNFPLEPTWNSTIKSLWERVQQVAHVLEEAWVQLQLQQRGNDPVTKFKGKMDGVLRNLKGLQLKDYRPEAQQLMNFHTGCLL